MVLLRVQSGLPGGGEAVARRFPFRVGRAANADWRLEAPGVWDQQFEIECSRADGLVLAANPASLTLVNGQRAERIILKNGDHIECGALKLQFWLSPTHQRGLRAREAVTWLGLIAFAGVQGFLCWWLTQ